jgi:type I restriction enzyme S subunit
MREGWEARALGEVAGLQIGRTPPRKETAYWTDDLLMPFCTIADMTGRQVKPSREGVTAAAVESGKAREVKAGTLLMSFKLTIGRVGFASVDLFPNEAIVAISPDRAFTSSEYLYLYLGSQDLSEGSSRAVKGSTLNSKSLASISVLLPPLHEQRRIVDLVQSVDAYIDALRALADAARTARSSLLHDLLTVGGEDWSESPLGELADFRPGKYLKKTEYENGGPFMVFGSNSIMGSHVDYLFDGPVIVMAGIGANAGAVRFSSEPCWINNNAFAIIAGESVRSEFLCFWLDTLLDLGLVRLGTGQPYIQKEILKSVMLPVPPLMEQDRVLELIRSIDDVLRATESAIEAGNGLRSALLSDLLSGDHEIPESYDTLLEAS